MGNEKFHRYANIFPMLSAPELERLAEDIRQNGQSLSCLMYQGQILDGRNRWRACEMLGIEARTEKFEGGDEQALAAVVSLNLQRRHLDSSQTAAVAVELESLCAEFAKQRKWSGKADLGQKIDQGRDRNAGRAAVQAIEMVGGGTNRTYVTEAKRLKEEDEESFEKLRTGEIKMADVIREKRREARRQRMAELAPHTVPPGTEKRYAVIYADPPWEYPNDMTFGAAADQYPTMPLEDICAIDVPSSESCVLFMWATSPLLEQAFQVLRAWGFKYHGSMVWVKPNGMGIWTRICHEMLLIGVKGDVPPPDQETRPCSVIQAKRTKHSAKPEEFAQTIESMFPGLARLEMFCRSPRPGWDVWGNESKRDQ